MVIGVEGNVHVGKTTYIRQFENYNVINEIAFNENLNDYDRQLFYIEKEKDKKKLLKNNTILDRTIISTAIYSLNSDKFNKYEKNKLKKILKNVVLNKEVIIPDYIHYILYPYKLICLNHKKLSKEKGTQNSLIDYDYYLKYNLFFSNVETIILNTRGYRQILKYDNTIFEKIVDPINVINKELISNNLDVIINKLNSMNKKEKLEFVEQMISKICLNKYITKIICLNSSKNILFYKIIDKNLGTMSNIYFVDNIKLVDNLKDKPLLLIDLFYEIIECIKRGEL